MRFCTSCGSTLSESTNFCTSCGGQAPSGLLAPSVATQTIEVRAPHLWHVTYATGQRGGPFTDDDIRGMIARQEIKVTDCIVAQGGTAWVPITQSPFGSLVATQASIDRLAASTCPRCGAAMAVVTKRSTMATILILVGIISTVFLIGIVLIIMGVTMRRKVKVAYQCPRCNYRT